MPFARARCRTMVSPMTTWVFLRGLMRESRHWGQFTAQFLAELPTSTIITLDFPGNGSLHASTSTSTVEAMAEHCRDQLQHAGHAPPYNVLALSLGAMVAVAWAERYPRELEKMVLINTSLAPHNPFYQRLRPTNYPSLFRFLIQGSLAEREALILRITSSQVAKDHTRAKEILREWQSYAEEYPIARKNIVRQLLAAMRYRAPATAPAVPMLLLTGLQDNLVNPECSLTLAKKWACAIKTHPGAGHDLPLDDGEWVAKTIKEWLSDIA
jgi:pimeloyl-ACP methyl ester carboxylesterase